MYEVQISHRKSDTTDERKDNQVKFSSSLFLFGRQVEPRIRRGTAGQMASLRNFSLEPMSEFHPDLITCSSTGDCQPTIFW
jgi:hypothetical protein